MFLVRVKPRNYSNHVASKIHVHIPWLVPMLPQIGISIYTFGWFHLQRCMWKILVRVPLCHSLSNPTSSPFNHLQRCGRAHPDHLPSWQCWVRQTSPFFVHEGLGHSLLLRPTVVTRRSILEYPVPVLVQETKHRCFPRLPTQNSVDMIA